MKAAMATSTSTAELVLRNAEGGEHPVNGICLIGREAECQITLDTPQVSRYHAKLTPKDARSVLVEDLHSTNGTFINGQRLSTPQLLSIGDELRLDRVAFRLVTASSGRAQATVFTPVEAVRAAIAASSHPTPPPFPASAIGLAEPAPANEPPLLQEPVVADVVPRVRPERREPEMPAIPEQPAVFEVPPSMEPIREQQPAPAAAPPTVEPVARVAAEAPPPAPPAAPDEPVREHTSMLGPEERERLNQIAHQGVRQQRSGGPRLIVLSAPARGQVIPLQRGGAGNWVIGRAADADVSLTDRTISAHHARLEKNGVNWRIENLKATNGLFVNGELVTDSELKNGDRIRLGGTELEFRTDQNSVPPPASKTPERKRRNDSALWLGVGAAVFVGITVLALLLGG